MVDSPKLSGVTYIDSIWDFQRTNSLFELPSVERFFHDPDNLTTYKSGQSESGERDKTSSGETDAIYTPLDACTTDSLLL